MKTIWIAALAAALIGCATKEESEPKPVVQVKVGRAETATVGVFVTAPATVFAREQANLAARVTAPILRLVAHKGDTVVAGQVLAQLENRDLEAQRREAAAAVTDAKATLEKTAAGTVPTDLEHGRGLVETSRAALNQAEKVFEKRKELFKEGAIPERDLLTSETDVLKARTDNQVALRSMELLQRQSSGRDVEIAKSRVEQAEARLASASVQLQYTEIRSPFAGTVTEQFMYPGDMAKPDAPMFTVADISSVTARAQVPEAQAGAVKIGQACSFLPVDSAQAAAGRITVVNKAVDSQRRTVEAWCEVSNGGAHSVRANVFGNVRIAVGSEPSSVVVPQSAVQLEEGTGKGTVFTVDEKHAAHKRDVEIGQIENGVVQIRSGLKAGESIVVDGVYGLAEGSEVKW
jgi:HlyD family secretion protein